MLSELEYSVRHSAVVLVEAKWKTLFSTFTSVLPFMRIYAAKPSWVTCMGINSASNGDSIISTLFECFRSGY